MRNLYIVWGVFICVVFAYGSYYGMTTSDLMSKDKWSPKGRQAYHK